MNEVRTLFENFWICKDSDKETFYKVKRDIPNFQKFVREQLGWKLIHTENLLKLEKRPAHAEPFMGISEFTEIRDYCILCAVLMYLEDKEEQEQFLLSELIDYVETQLKSVMAIDWTSFSQRKSLVRVLQYMERLQMLRVYEGKSEAFSQEAGQEVLYENTGYSKYFATTFPTDISEYKSWQDFEKSDFEELSENRGAVRIHRVYRQLSVCPSFFWEGNEDADALYLKNQRQWVGKYLQENLGGNLEIYKNTAFLTLDADDCYGLVHPRDAMLSEAVLLVCAKIREKEECGEFTKTDREELELQIGQYEDYLNRPDIVEKANRLKELSGVLDQIRKESEQLNRDLATFGERLRSLMEDEPKIKEHLQKELLEETRLKAYFEEELALGLVIERDTKTLAACAQEAQKELRDSDKNREPSELLQALNQVYLKNSGSLVSYGTSLEECFGEMEISQKLQAAAEPGAQGGTSAMRRRVRVVSVWNGKKVYLEEFYGILKAAIEETQMLIQKKDRELFEDILSQTISQQLTDRIAESRKWVQDMSQLMHGMDTSMGLSFSLDWKPCRAENDAELDTTELEQILLRDRALLTMEDIEKVASHFRSRIRMEKQKLEESNTTVNYMDLIRDALDYRKWFSFQMYFKRGAEQRKPLTNAAFNRFSGGEKAMAMYVPLFAAVNAQYQKADRKDHPRMIALDEAFAGVDDKNISSMFELVHQLDFDYIMNSQALWGCYETVKKLRIAELLRPQNSQTVSVIRYTWNGRERMLDEQ